MERLAVLRLTLSDFRSYAHLRLETDPRPVVLTGHNGAGKTNILEALSFLTPGRGLRRARLSDVARREAGAEAPWAVAATIGGPTGPTEVGTGREAGSERRVVRIDGQAVKGQMALADVLSAIWLVPAMDRLFTEGAGGRRRFFDRLAFGLEPGHARAASAYEHAMRERMRLLKGGRADASWLAALEETMARRGAEMAAARVRVAAELDRACGQGIGPFPAARLQARGALEESLADGAEIEAVADGFRDRLAALRRRDAEAGMSTEGPHRSDFAVRHAAKDLPAEQCSTGEQKAVLVAIVLGQARVQAARRGIAPMLLLDEIAAHLDEVRRAALFDELCAIGAQSWMTGTEASQFAGLGERAQFFRVADHAVSRLEGR